MRQALHRADPGMRLLAEFGFSRLADELGVRPNTVSQWKSVPAERLLEVERITGVRRDFLRPAIFIGMRLEGDEWVHEPEEWRPVAGYEGLYEVSSWGRVCSLSRSRLGGAFGRPCRIQEKILQEIDGKDGYRRVNLHKDGIQKLWSVAQLVLAAFHGPRPSPQHQSAHKDRNIYNNAASNLCWATAKENEAHKIEHGTKLFGEKHHQAVLTEEIVRQARKLAASGVSHTELADRFGVTQSAMSAAIRGETWRHVA